MVDTKSLKSLLVQKELTQRQVAESINMPESTFYSKMSSGKFGANDMVLIADAIGMTDSEKLAIFFYT